MAAGVRLGFISVCKRGSCPQSLRAPHPVLTSGDKAWCQVLEKEPTRAPHPLRAPHPPGVACPPVWVRLVWPLMG